MGGQGFAAAVVAAAAQKKTVNRGWHISHKNAGVGY